MVPSALNCHARRSARRTQKSRGRAGLLSEHEAALLVLHAPVLLGVRRNLLLVVGQLAPRLGRDLLLPLLERAARHLGGLLLGEPGGARLVLSVRGLDRRALLLEVRRELALRAGLDGASLERVPRLRAADQLGPRRVLVLLHRLPGLARGRLTVGDAAPSAEGGEGGRPSRVLHLTAFCSAFSAAFSLLRADAGSNGASGAIPAAASVSALRRDG
mmetsp:Transcript_38698/g.115835  ORF Transcript_38698/g.115835 Transcript_38698/m.115835 type:complete len:216 (+) Transcript_38698:746-1393(+)